MSSKIDYKEPPEEQLFVMKEFADICSDGIEIISRYQTNIVLQAAALRLQEAMHHFHSYILNGGRLLIDSDQNKNNAATFSIIDVDNVIN